MKNEEESRAGRELTMIKVETNAVSLCDERAIAGGR
jgi:hypothetical protein